jgi:hypothetical protein
LYRVNLAKTAVNVVADRLTVAAVTVPDDEAATALIADVWADNELDLHQDAFTRRACEYGDSYALCWPEVDDSAEDGEPEPPASVEIAFHDPMCMRLFYDPEHPSEKLYGIKRWKMTDGRIRATLYYADHGERWVIKGKDMKELEPGAWLPYAEDGLDAEFDNPYGEVPIFHYRTAAPYGVPEHIDAYGPQAAINKSDDQSGCDDGRWPASPRATRSRMTRCWTTTWTIPTGTTTRRRRASGRAWPAWRKARRCATRPARSTG